MYCSGIQIIRKKKKNRFLLMEPNESYYRSELKQRKTNFQGIGAHGADLNTVRGMCIRHLLVRGDAVIT